MELAVQSLSHANLPSCSTSLSPPSFQYKGSLLASNSILFQSSKTKTLFTQRQSVRIKARKHRNLGAICASEAESTSTDVADRWLLEPVGDGDTRHIGFKVQMPGPFEIASSEVTVGRLPEKADMVIPVATVSGLHARIWKKAGSLFVTDLDSTNGTFIDERRLRPGVVATVLPGSCITFGDTHLAVFRVSKLENVEAGSKPEKSEDKTVADSPTESTEATS